MMKIYRFLMMLTYAQLVVASETPIKNGGVLFTNKTGQDGKVLSVTMEKGKVKPFEKPEVIKGIPNNGSEVIAVPQDNVGVFFQIGNFKSLEFTAKELQPMASVTFTYKHGKPMLMAHGTKRAQSQTERKSDAAEQLTQAQAANTALQHVAGECNTKLRESQARVQQLEQELVQAKQAKS